MEKYFEDNKAVIDLPCIITISKSSVSIQHASNTETEDIPDTGLTIQVGNIKSYNPTPINTEPVPEVNPTQPDEPGGDEPGGGSGGDNEGGNSGGQEGGGDNPGGSTITDGDGISFKIHNNLDIEVRLSGMVILNVGKNINNNSWDIDKATQVYANIFEDPADTSYHKNHISIPKHLTYTSKVIKTTKYYTASSYPNGQLPSPSYSELIDGTWRILGVTNPSNGGSSVCLYSAHTYGDGELTNTGDHIHGVPHKGSSMYVVDIPSDISIANKKQFDLYINKTIQNTSGNSMTLQPDMTGYYVVLQVQ